VHDIKLQPKVPDTLRRCQTHYARQYVKVPMLVEASEPFKKKRFPEVQCTTALKSKHPHLCYSTLTTIIPHSLRVNLSRTYRSLLALSAISKSTFFLVDQLRDIVFTELTSRSTVNPTKVVASRNFRGGGERLIPKPPPPHGHSPVMTHWIKHRCCIPWSHLKPTRNTFLIKQRRTLKLQNAKQKNEKILLTVHQTR
jgi:hypothetical protein